MELKSQMEAQLQEYLPRFVMNQVKRVADMQAALDQNDMEKVQFLNHQIKGCALSFGFTELDRLSENLSDNYGSPKAARHIVNLMQKHLDNSKIA